MGRETGLVSVGRVGPLQVRRRDPAQLGLRPRHLRRRTPPPQARQLLR